MIFSYQRRSTLAVCGPCAAGGTLARLLAIAAVVLLLAVSPAGAVIDLRIQFVGYTAPLPGPVAGEAFPLAVTIINDGNETSPSFNVNIWQNLPAAPTSAAGSDQQVTVDSLAPGNANARTVVFDVTYGSPGTYFLWVAADIANAVTEVTKANNIYSVLIPVAISAADLIIESIVPSTDTPEAGTPFTVAVTVKNQGRVATGPFNVAFFKNAATAPTSAAGSDANVAVSGLDAGASTVVNYEATYDASGNYEFWALADSGNAITEADKGNNAAGVTFTIGDAGSGSSGHGGCGKGAGAANLVGFYVLCVAGLLVAKGRGRISRT